MAGLGGIVSLLVKNAVKSAVKFELAIDPIIAKFEGQCPPKAELDKILQQKNQLSQAVTQIQTSLTSLSNTGSTVDGIITGIKVGVNIIKALPIPSSVPPGVGIPLNVINGFSDTLDLLSVLLKEFGGVTSQIAPSLEIITKTLATVNSKLSMLDGLLVGCLEAETEGMTDLEKEEFFQKLGIDLSSPDTTGGSNNPNSGVESENSDVNETLESRLSPNSNNPIVYKGFTIILDNDAGNKFSFPNRRAIGTNEEGVRIVTPFSFSSSTQILIDTVKFEIDQLGSIELSRLARESKIEQLIISEATVRADSAFKNYKAYVDRQMTKNILKFNPSILNTLFDAAVEKYQELLALSPTMGYPKEQLKILKETQSSILKSSKERQKSFQASLDPLNLSGTINNIANSYAPSQPSTSSTISTSTSTPQVSYLPFNGPGTVNGEVRFKDGKSFRYLAGSKKWVDHTPSTTPFSYVGLANGSLSTLTRYGNDSDGQFRIEDTYEWNNLLYKWVFKSTETFGNL